MNKKEENLEALKAFLTEKKIKFKEHHPLYHADGHVADLYIPKHLIVVHLSDTNDQTFYLATRRRMFPFFIRETETKEFTVEKIQNCIISAMKKLHNIQSRKKAREEYNADTTRKQGPLSEELEADTGADTRHVVHCRPYRCQHNEKA